MTPASSALHPASIRRKVLLGFGLVLAMLAVLATISFRSTRRFIRNAEWSAQTYEVIELVERTRRQLMEVESAGQGLLRGPQAEWQRAFDEALEGLRSNVTALRFSTADFAPQSSRQFRVETLLELYVAEQQAALDGRVGAAVEPSPASSRALEELRVVLADLESQQRTQLLNHSRETRLIGHATTFGIVAGTALTFLALIVACVLILRDVGARRRAEEALASEHNLLSSIIDTMPAHVFVKDVKGRYILDNAAHRKYLGLQDDEGAEGRTVFDYFSIPAAERFHEEDRQVIETGQLVLNREEPDLLRGSVSERWLETTKVPLRDVDGTIVGLVGISADISARKAAEEKLRHFAAQLERSNAELANFASVASHDLQEPLRKIQAFGDRLRVKCGTELGERGRDYLGRMENAAQRMQTLIQDLLKLSRITSRAAPFEPCDLGEIARGVISDLEVAIEQQHAVIERSPLPTIDADPLQMRQLFQNLISNALKFHRPEAPPMIRIMGRVLDAAEQPLPGEPLGSKICEITVADHGIGFGREFAEQIFVVFQRLHNRLDYEGTGIGLAVCRKITDRHGGTIVARSAEGQGATFVVTLPVRQTSPSAHEKERDADYDLDGR